MIICLESIEDGADDFIFCWRTIALRGVDCGPYEIRMGES
jgi:hypothetical protein